MNKSTSNLLIGILLLLLAAYFAYTVAQTGARSHQLTGMVIFALLGVGFIRNSRRR